MARSDEGADAVERQEIHSTKLVGCGSPLRLKLLDAFQTCEGGMTSIVSVLDYVSISL